MTKERDGRRASAQVLEQLLVEVRRRRADRVADKKKDTKSQVNDLHTS